MAFIGTILGGLASVFTANPAFLAAGMGFDASQGQKATNDQQIQLGREQMDFQERMSNTAYQRSTKDMEAAGLNPMLAYSQGGATTPTGNMPIVQNPVPVGSSSAAAAMNAAAAAQQIQQTRASTDLATAQAEKVRSETMTNDLNTAALTAEVNRTLAQAGATEAERQNTIEKILGTRYASQSAQMQYRAKMGNSELNDTAFGAEARDIVAHARKTAAEAKSAEYGLSKDKAESDFYQTGLGRSAPGLQAIGSAANSAQTVVRTLRGR